MRRRDLLAIAAAMLTQFADGRYKRLRDLLNHFSLGYLTRPWFG